MKYYSLFSKVAGSRMTEWAAVKSHCRWREEERLKETLCNVFPQFEPTVWFFSQDTYTTGRQLYNHTCSCQEQEGSCLLLKASDLVSPPQLPWPNDFHDHLSNDGCLPCPGALLLLLLLLVGLQSLYARGENVNTGAASSQCAPGSWASCTANGANC